MQHLYYCVKLDRTSGQKDTNLAHGLVPDAAQTQDLTERQAEDGPPQPGPCSVVQGPGQSQRPGPDQLCGEESQHQEQAVAQVGLLLLGVF